jgi:glycosyltransferase involved in cell wall biosynthesis
MLCAGGLEHSGGIGRWAGYLVPAWRARGLAPPLHIIDTRGHGGWPVAARAFVAALAQLVRLRLSGRLLLIHANTSTRGSTVRKTIVAALAGVMGVPLIVQVHDGRYIDFYRSVPAPARAAIRWLFRRPARVIVLGRIWRDLLSTEIGVPRERMMILPNAVALPPRLARATPPDGIVHIVLLSRLWEPKGLPELMQALGSAELRGRHWRATLAGDGDVERYRQDAVRRGIAERIAFPGWLDAPGVARLLEESDVCVLPSHVENLPVAVVEAMACRVAVVTTPVGAVPEILRDEESALFVPVNDAAALTAALARVIDDAGLRRRLAAAGHAYFLENLEIGAAATRLAGLYRSVLGAGGA